MTTRHGDWMQTFTGHAFWPLDPRPEEIRCADIAHALSMLCRFGGHTSRFYSVAEHSVLVSENVPAQHALWGLLHDASEAYLVDMPRPIKRFLPDYVEAERKLMSAVCERFGLDVVEPPEVRLADRRVLRDECLELMRTPPMSWGEDGLTPLGVDIVGWQPAEAERRFTQRLADLLAVR